MLNLSEQWKKAYAEYALEEASMIDNEIDTFCEELMEAQAQTTKSFALLEEYCNTLEVLKEDPIARNNDSTAGSVDNLHSLMKELIKVNSGTSTTDLSTYKPTASYTVQHISDMGFPDNIIFFIKSIIQWIRNVVLFFIEKIKNIFRRLVGADPVEFDYNKLKLNLEKAKKIEQFSQSVDIGSGQNDVIRAYKTDSLQKIELMEGVDDSKYKSIAHALGIVRDKDEISKTENVVVTVDLSRDLMNLKELMQHFYDLFDNAFGSNNEHLFATDDLEIVLGMFKDAVDRVKKGDLNVYSINDVAVSSTGISKDKVKQNVLSTNANLTNLKEAYQKTAQNVKKIVEIINSKEMLMLSSLGVDFSFLTSSTYEQIKRILDTMPARMREAKKLESGLTKMQAKYEKITKELLKMQQKITSIGTVTFDTIQNRTVTELSTCSSWMTQVVTLRLTALALYIKEMQEVRNVLTMLANINKNKKF